MRPDADRAALLAPTLLLIALSTPALARAGARSTGLNDGAARSIETALDGILGRHVRGGLVDYTALARDGELPSLVESLSAVDPERLASRAERLAFWINAYNALVLKGVVDAYPIRSVSEAGSLGKWEFFKRLEFTVGGRHLTLDGIEHGILRPGFEEPRIHFALVCAARGCPDLRPAAFHGDRVEAELEEAARRFVNDPRKVRLDRGAGVLHLSRIFEWYREDFLKGSPTLIAFVGKYLEGGPPPAGTPVEYMDYSWDLNDLRSEPRDGRPAPRAP